MLNGTKTLRRLSGEQRKENAHEFFGVFDLAFTEHHSAYMA